MYTYRNNSGKTYINNSHYFVGCGIEWLLEEIFLFIGLFFFNNAWVIFIIQKNLKRFKNQFKKKKIRNALVVVK